MISGMRVGPILMQLDLQSVEEVPFQYVRTSFCPENVGNWSASPRNDLGFSPRSVQTELFPASPGAHLQEITVSTFSIQLGQIRLQPPIGSTKTFFSIRWTIVIVFDPVESKKC